jgi:hypothetical protein
MHGSTQVVSGDEGGNPYLGWLVSLLLIALVVAIGAGLWIHYHGL